jgi:glycosyltransferase involved in cell wall biosynthesis
VYLKLAVVSHQSLSTLGGISVHIRQLAEALTDLGVEVEVIAPVSKPARQYTSYSFEIMPIPLTSKLKTMRILEYSYKVFEYLAENRKMFDAVHGSQWSMFFPCLRKHRIKLPLVTKFHGTVLFGIKTRLALSPFPLFHIGDLLALPMYNYIESSIATMSDGLIFVNNSVRKEVEVLTHHILPSKIRTIYNGVDTDKFKPLGAISELRYKYGLSDEDIVLLYVGRLEPLKGIHRIINVGKKLLSDNFKIKILIVGDGDKIYIKYLHSIAKPKDKFIFLGWMPHNKLTEIYNVSDVFVSPSPYSSGNNILEAMACGKPVVAVRGLGFDELIKHNKTGFLIDNINAEHNLEKCLKNILVDKKLLEEIGKNARLYIKENLSWEKTAEQTIKFIKDILNEKDR